MPCGMEDALIWHSVSTAKKYKANKEESNSTVLLYLTKLPRHSSVGIITKSKVDTSVGQRDPLSTVQSHSHQHAWPISPVLFEWFCCQVWFYLLAEILLLVWTPGEWLQACLPLAQLPASISYSQGREPSKTVSTKNQHEFCLILLGLELVSTTPSSLFTNYCTEANSAVLLSVALFPDTFFCQTGF